MSEIEIEVLVNWEQVKRHYLDKYIKHEIAVSWKIDVIERQVSQNLQRINQTKELLQRNTESQSKYEV